MMTCEKFVEGAESKPYICATCGGEQHLHPGACDHCGGHRTAPDGWALRQGFTPCPFCAPPLPAGLDTLDFVQAEREADACGHPQHYRIWQERFSAELQRQCAALIAQAREEERERLGAIATEYNQLLNRLNGHSWSSREVMEEVLRVMEAR